jgi:hypothetical protein
MTGAIVWLRIRAKACGSCTSTTFVTSVHRKQHKKSAWLPEFSSTIAGKSTKAVNSEMITCQLRRKLREAESVDRQVVLRLGDHPLYAVRKAAKWTAPRKGRRPDVAAFEADEAKGLSQRPYLKNVGRRMLRESRVSRIRRRNGPRFRK